MEWTTLQHLDLQHVARGILQPLQPHAAAFHHTQALVAAAIGTYIIEFDALTGSKLSTIDIGSPVVRMSYSPAGGQCVIAILEDCTIRSCDFDAEQTCVLHSPQKKSEHISSDADVHLALTPLQPIVFFGFHKRMSVTVVGTIEGGRAPTKIKTDLKKPIVNLACHPRLPVLVHFHYVAYAEGLIRAYNIHTYAVLYTLQLDYSIKLLGAGAFAFHPMLEWIFVGDRRGTILAWDVSTERPIMIGITQVGSQPITSVAWLSMLRLLIILSKDGTLHVWKTRLEVNTNKTPTQVNFFEPASIESLDIPRLLSQQNGEAVCPLPRIKALEVHPKLNLAALLFANMTSAEMKNRAAYTREGRKQLFAVLQSARGSSASFLKEKLSSMGSSGILADHHLQAQLQEQHNKGQSHLTISDIARKAFLYSHFMEGHAKTVPISRLPLITIMDSKNQQKDIPVCQPFHLELNFFNKENRVLHYPSRAFYVEGMNLMAYNLCSGAESIYKKLFTSLPGNVEYYPKHMVYSKKRHLFLVIYEFSGTTNEVVLYWENTDLKLSNSKGSTVKGFDAAFIGPNENHFAILDEDKSGLALYILPGAVLQEANRKKGAVEPNLLPDEPVDANLNSVQGPIPFMFDTEVDHIFSTPIESTLIFACNGKQIGLAKLIQGSWLPNSDGHYISTKTEGKKYARLKANEIVLQRVSLINKYEVTLVYVCMHACSSRRMKYIYPRLINLFDFLTRMHFRSLLWVGPALLFSTATAVCILGWDGKVRTILSISMPNAILVGALNDRLLLANPTDINPRQKRRIEIKSCLVGLLEPLLIARGPPVCGDLAVSLSQVGPQFTQVLRGVYAIRALRFSITLSILKDEFVRSRDYPKCPPTSHLFYQFRQLGYACIKYGQFDSAKETFEVRADYESMLDLFICHLNPSAMRRLTQRLEEEESMVPKSPEWGGGNWEIKIPMTLKSIPQWELAAEVMPYMMTNNGAIPSIILDHIGVYLGVIKGRGNVIEVREDSLVIPRATDSKPNRVHTSMAKSIDKFVGIAGGGTKADSFMGLKTLMKPHDSSTTSDEQAKAAEEFKKTIYGTANNGSNSDEEGVSKTKKLQIRIRDKPTSGTVDVNKIKEATKTKSLSGVFQDLGQSQQQPYPATSGAVTNPTISAPGDPFGTEPWAQPTFLSKPTPVPTKGVGIAAGPIPEDFFQNTILSLQVVAALPPPGTLISKLDHTSQLAEVGRKVPPDQVDAPVASAGLLDGGVPPQATEQSIPSESFVLPDGGVPPQYTAPAAGMPRPQVQLAQTQLSTQPLDLSALGFPVTTESGKSTPPALVRPGQIAVTLLQEISRLQKVQGPRALSAKDEMARLSRHLGSLPLQVKHRINCIRTAIKKNMDVQNCGYAKKMLELLLFKAPPSKQEKLRSLIDICVQRGLTNKSIDPLEDPSQFCGAILGRLSTIGYDVCDLCGAKFSALSTPGCIICGLRLPFVLTPSNVQFVYHRQSNSDYEIFIIADTRDLNCGCHRVFGRVAFIAVADITNAIAVIADIAVVNLSHNLL
ncbi:hypothetical protein J1N35_022009 [Gossypium stocksii]|uniref:Transducin/WD40 repeat-like superfamily protein n=1 Tax=Gossypium stocksii TaxID=47602 RepID=A0A9D3VFX1_9ROSI|nr:hypothetical protein J1N35_022009 [Gossypium stocksii]